MLIQGILAQSQASFVGYQIDWCSIDDHKIHHVEAQIPVSCNISQDFPHSQTCLLESSVPCRQEYSRRINNFEG